METVLSALERAKTGVEGLDDVLHGGFVQERLYLIQGSPGAGKTTLSLHFLMQGVRRGDRCLYITLSETKEELCATAKAHELTMEGIDIVELIADQRELESETQLTMYNPAEVELSETTKRVLEAIEQFKPTRVVFDSLSELRLLAQNSLRYCRQILALKSYFSGVHCTALLLDDQPADGTDLQLQSIAHGVISLEQLVPLYGAARRRLRVVKYRGTSYRGGYHDFSIVKGGLKVFPRLIAAEHGSTFPHEHIKSGVHGIDALLGGGVDRGTSTLLLGPAGSGKSTVAIQYAVAAADRGDIAYVFAFDENLATIQARMEGLGVNVNQARSAGRLKIQTIDPAEVSPGEFAQTVRDAVEFDNAKVIVIDSLNGYTNAMPGENFLTAQFHELLSYLGHKGITTFMVVAQHGLVGGHMETPVDTSYLADTVVLFRYFEYAGRVKKAISVVKKRSGIHEETIRELCLSEKGIEISEPLSRLRGILTGVPFEEKSIPDEHMLAGD